MPRTRPLTRAAAFAAALTARHRPVRPRPRMTPMTPMTLVRRPAPAGIVHRAGDLIVRPALRYELRTALGPGAGGRHVVRERLRVETLTLAQRTQETIVRRTTRVEYRRLDGNPAPSVAVRAPTSAPASLPLPPAAPVLIRGARMSAPAVRSATPAASRNEPSALAPARAMELPPGEVQRLTDHVMHAIDRRLTAYRDRRGRS